MSDDKDQEVDQVPSPEPDDLPPSPTPCFESDETPDIDLKDKNS